MAETEKIGSALLRARLAASGGAHNPHGPACPLRLLRAGGHHQTRARYALNRFLPGVGISAASRQVKAASGGAHNPHGPAGTACGRDGSLREASRGREFGVFRPSEPETWLFPTARTGDREKCRKRSAWKTRSRSIPAVAGSLTLRLLRAGGHHQTRARYALNRFLPGVGISAASRQVKAASGGAHNPHGPACPLRLLRAGGHHQTRARYALNRFLPGVGISAASRQVKAASGGAHNPHGPAGTACGRDGSLREASRGREFGVFRPSEPETWLFPTARTGDREKCRKRSAWKTRSRSIPAVVGSLTLRLLRAGGHHQTRARYALNRFLPWVGISAASRQVKAASGGAHNPHGPAGTSFWLKN